MTALLAKLAIPVIFLLAGFSGGMVTSQRLQKPPECNCPEQKPCNGIDFDKIKSRNLTIQNQQYLTINGDTILIEKITAGLREELERLNIKRCK